jgi:hypothetical protein
MVNKPSINILVVIQVVAKPRFYLRIKKTNLKLTKQNSLKIKLIEGYIALKWSKNRQ